MSETGSAAPGVTSGVSPSSQSSPAPASATSGSSSSPKTVNLGMGPQGAGQSKSQSGATGRLTSEQLFQEYGEDIFKHDRFKELTGYKQQWEAVAPLVQEFGSPDDLVRFNTHLGPLWKALISGDSAKANATWQKLYPIMSAVINGQDIDQFLAKTVQAAQQAQGDQLDDDDPLRKELTEVKKEFGSFKEQLEQKETIERNRQIQEVATTNYNKYEERFQTKAKELNIPEAAWEYLGEIMTNRIIRHMPLHAKTQQPLNPVYNYNEAAFDKCFEKEVMTAYKAMTRAGVDNAVVRTREGGPAIPNTNSQGSTPGGTGVPPNRQAKAERMAQFFGSGR